MEYTSGVSWGGAGRFLGNGTRISGPIFVRDPGTSDCGSRPLADPVDSEKMEPEEGSVLIFSGNFEKRKTSPFKALREML